jgi:hypothetical protein
MVKWLKSGPTCDKVNKNKDIPYLALNGLKGDKAFSCVCRATAWP